MIILLAKSHDLGAEVIVFESVQMQKIWRQ